MNSHAASRREHRRFCEIEGWAEVLNARGKPTEHHITYELALGDGRVYRTRISRPANTDMAPLSGTVTNGRFNVFCFFIDAAGGLTSAIGVESITLAGVRFRPR